MSDCPEYYAAPLTKREDIVAYLNSKSGWDCRYYSPRQYLFCFNVKLRYDYDFTFEHLLDLTGTEEQCKNDKTWLESARKIFGDEFSEDDEFQHALETMQEDWHDRDHCLWEGDVLEVGFDQCGRSGGWMCLAKFEGHELYENYGEVVFEDWSIEDLTKLYKFVIQLKHDLSPAMLKSELEYQVAWSLEHILEDVQTLEEITAASIGSGI